VIDLQDGIFLDHAKQDEHSQRRIEVDRLARQPKRDESEWNRKWQRQQNRKRMDQAFELRRENDVHQNHGEQKRPEKFSKRAFQFPAPTGNASAVSGRQIHLMNLGAHRRQPVSQCVAGRNRGAQTHLALPVQTVDA